MAGILLALSAAAQAPLVHPSTEIRQDRIIRQRDSLHKLYVSPRFKPEKVYHPDSAHSPHRAVMHSIVLPGWGQAYNKQVWKVPLIYGGFSAFGYYYWFNHKYYRLYENQAHALLYHDHPLNPDFAGYRRTSTEFHEAALNNLRNVQLCLLGAAALWGINVMDSYIQAKFIHSYSIDNNLSLHISPQVLPIYAGNLSVGMRVQVEF